MRSTNIIRKSAARADRIAITKRTEKKIAPNKRKEGGKDIDYSFLVDEALFTGSKARKACKCCWTTAGEVLREGEEREGDERE
jgi:hypothetical protein